MARRRRHVALHVLDLLRLARLGRRGVAIGARARHGPTAHVAAAHVLSHRLFGAALHSHARPGAGLVTGLADPVITPNGLSSRGALHASRACARLLGKSDRSEAEHTYGSDQASRNDKLFNID